MEQREAEFKRINRIFSWVYIIFGAVLIAAYALRRDTYHLGISLGIPLVPAVLALIYRVLRIRPVEQLSFSALAFVFLSYPLGCCVDFYRIVPGFDKLAHTLSGVFVSQLALALYYALKPGRRIERQDCRLALAFMFLGSMAVAGLWEIAEYFLNLLTGIDVQRVQTTGVNDTVQDMIVCMLGTLATLPLAAQMCRGGRNIIADGVRAFVEINLSTHAPANSKPSSGGEDAGKADG